ASGLAEMDPRLSVAVVRAAELQTEVDDAGSLLQSADVGWLELVLAGAGGGPPLGGGDSLARRGTRGHEPAVSLSGAVFDRRAVAGGRRDNGSNLARARV